MAAPSNPTRSKWNTGPASHVDTRRNASPRPLRAPDDSPVHGVLVRPSPPGCPVNSHTQHAEPDLTGIPFLARCPGGMEGSRRIRPCSCQREQPSGEGIDAASFRIETEMISNLDPEVLRQRRASGTVDELVPERGEQTVVLVVDEIGDSDRIPLIEQTTQVGLAEAIYLGGIGHQERRDVTPPVRG